MRPVYPGSTARHGACPPRRPVKQGAKARKALIHPERHPCRISVMPQHVSDSVAPKATEWFEVASKFQMYPLDDRPKHLRTREHPPSTIGGFVATQTLLATAPQHGATAALFTLIVEAVGCTRITTRT